MSDNDPEAFLLTAVNNVEADMLESLLKAYDIPVLRKYRENGEYMMIMMGGTVCGVDLYVPGDMLDKAREIVDDSRKASEDAAFPDNVKNEESAGDGLERDCVPVEDTAEPAETNPAVSAEQELFVEELKNDNRKRRISWLILLFLIAGLICVVSLLVKYLYGLFAG